VKHKLATTLLVVAALVLATLTLTSVTTARPALAAGGGPWPIDTYGLPKTTDSVILKWDEQLLSTIRAHPAQTGPTITARALGVLHTATYDAWAAYDPTAKGTRPDGPAQQTSGNTLANKQAAISYAAARVLNDLFPVPSVCSSPPNPPTPFCPTPSYKTPDTVLSGSLGYPINTTPASPTDTAATPAGVGNLAAKAVLDFRHTDGSNQLGGYSDNTYTTPNTWNSVPLTRHWQPLCVLTAAGVTAGQPPVRDPNSTCPDADPPKYYIVQKPLHPQWGNITPFGPLDPETHYPDQFQLSGPPNDNNDVTTALSDTSNLSDAAKVKAEYWADGPKSEFPPGHMAAFAQAISRMRQNTLDQDVKLFFVLGNALMDASISAWASKYQYDFWRPTTAIRELYKDKLVTSWLGPKKGYGKVLGQNWMPYQALNVVTPAFPEYVSGHSTFSAAGRTVLAAFYGNENFGARVTIKAGSSQIEPGVTPAKDVVLSWKTLSDAADEAGMSRRYGGIHFWNGDQQGRVLGRLIGYNDWNEAQTYFNPTP
jgi:PAP2 superfamily